MNARSATSRPLSDDGSGPTGSEARPRVLMVDDHPPNLVALKAILDPLDLDLVSATSGEDALLKLLKSDFALILMDVQMPGLDGFEVTALIKKRERSRHIPIIFLTAINRDTEHVFRGYAEGAVDYLLKPFAPEILRSKVGVFVELFVQRQTIQRQERELREREREAMERRSEARFRELVDAVPGLVFAVRPDGAIYYTNRAWRDYDESVQPTDVLGLPGVHPDDRQGVRARWSEALRGATPFEWEFRLSRGDSCRWHLGRAAPQLDEHGRVVGWIATGTDIDDAKRAEHATAFAARAGTRLAESLSLDATVAAIADLIVPELADTSIVQLLDERGAVEIACARPPDATLPSEGRPPPHALALPLVSQGRTIGRLWAARQAQEGAFAREDRGALEDLARRASAALANAELFEAASRERRRAEEANQVKDHFLAMISHELRTPLTSILGWARRLLEGRVPLDMRSRALETILRSAQTQTQLIEDLLDISRITSGKLRLEPQEILPVDVVEAAIEVLQPTADAKEVALDVALDREAGPVFADPERLQQVVWNLIANAIKFSPRGGRVAVSLRRAGETVELAVADGGVGIAPEFLARVFERFAQAENAPHSGGGLGLGLAITKNLVELHGGTITAESEGRGKGARFVVALPLRTPGST